MTEINETNIPAKPKTTAPILLLNRLNYVKIGGKVLDTTSEQLDKYIAYASEKMNTQITSVIVWNTHSNYCLIVIRDLKFGSKKTNIKPYL